MTITRAEINQYKLVAKIGKEAFLEAHGKSAPKEDILDFIEKNYSEQAFYKELMNPDNIYHFIYHKNQVVGYSKIILSQRNTNTNDQPITKLDRLYLLKEFYGQNFGAKLFDFIVAFSKEKKEQGIWLAVWVENHRAISFYTKKGFQIIGNYNFKISETHSNPNHIMYLKYE